MFKIHHFLLATLLVFHASSVNSITIKTIFGVHTVNEPIIEELIASPAFQRLQGINQYGCNHYTVSTYDYTRYSHSLGVFMLLRLYNAPLKEQIAGLLHDISHTVFSHVGDHLFRNSNYQDDIHGWYICKSGIIDILEKYSYTVEDVNIKNGEFPLLEQSLPDLCADRIEYIIHGGYLEGKLDLTTIDELLKHLHFKDGNWYFDDLTHARKFADISLYLTEHLFAGISNTASYDWCATALQRALEINELTFNDIHFSTDDHVWHMLTTSSDPIIKTYMNCVQNYKKHSQICSEKDADKYFSPKFRGVNPWVKTDNGLRRLTELDTSYNTRYTKLQNYLAEGYYVKYFFDITN